MNFKPSLSTMESGKFELKKGSIHLDEDTSEKTSSPKPQQWNFALICYSFISCLSIIGTSCLLWGYYLGQSNYEAIVWNFDNFFMVVESVDPPSRLEFNLYHFNII